MEHYVPKIWTLFWLCGPENRAASADSVPSCYAGRADLSEQSTMLPTVLRCMRCKTGYPQPPDGMARCPKCGCTKAAAFPPGDLRGARRRGAAPTDQPDRRPYYPPRNYQHGQPLRSIAELGEARFGKNWRRPTARSIEVSDRLVRRWESGQSKCSPDHLRRAAWEAERHRNVIDERLKDAREVLRRFRDFGGAPAAKPDARPAVPAPGAYAID